MACNNIALLIGIDKYVSREKLTCCENDAKIMSEILARDYNGEKYFSIETMLSDKGKLNQVSERITNLFNNHSADIVFFYFAGHAAKFEDDTYLLTADYSQTCPGISMHHLLCLAAKCTAKKKVIMLDCCFSGSFGTYNYLNHISMIPDDTVILASTSSGAKAYGYGEKNGVFTSLVRDAINSNIGNIFGEVTTEDIYKFIQSALSPWDQSPVYKANILKPIVLKKQQPKVTVEELNKMTHFFRNKNSKKKLSEKYIKFSETSTEELRYNEQFSLIEKLYRYGLVTPSNTSENLYQTALSNQTIELTNLGKFYYDCYANNRL